MANFEAPPKHLATVVRDVIAHAWYGTPVPKKLQQLIEWYEDDGWDSLISGWGSEQVALKLFYLAWSNFFDAELQAMHDIAGKIQDSDRVEFVKSLIANSFQEFDEYLCLSIHALPISTVM